MKIELSLRSYKLKKLTAVTKKPKIDDIIPLISCEPFRMPSSRQTRHSSRSFGKNGVKMKQKNMLAAINTTA